MTGEAAFALLDTPVLVVSDCQQSLAHLAVCYAGAPSGGTVSEPIRARLTRNGDDHFVVEVDSRDTRTAASQIEAVRTLNHELVHAIMLRRREFFYVHAGVVAHDRRAIILPGLSQAGKSTLVLALLARGARYMSDELLVYEPASGIVRGYPRAPKIRDVCVEYFPEHSSEFVGAGEGRFLRLDSGVILDEARPGLVIAPQWRADGDDALRPLSAGETLLRLVSSTLNFGMQRERSVDILATLASTVAGFDLAWRDPHACAERILAEASA